MRRKDNNPSTLRSPTASAKITLISQVASVTKIKTNRSIH
jgi:hypothetical protein